MATLMCHGCARDDEVTTADLTLHLSVDLITHTFSWLCWQCGHTNERSVSGTNLDFLLAVGVPVVRPELVSIVFADELDDPELTAAYMNKWARQ